MSRSIGRYFVRFSYISILVAFVIVVSLSACSKTAEPERDETPPNLEFYLEMYPVENGHCPTAASYYINPRASSDNISSNSDLLMRWDYQSDGVWDTEFEVLDSVLRFYPRPIPQGTWVVTGEIKDEAGNSTIETKSILTPTWLPTTPDIVAGEVVIETNDSHFNDTSVDTLRIGEEFIIWLQRRDWVNELGARATQRYYIDSILIAENSGQTNYPLPGICNSSGKVIYNGIQELGLHKIVVEVGLNGGIVESNTENNSASRMVLVVE